MKKLNKKGFTLVELLAVIVVLALLMVVAASSIGNALKNSKMAATKTEAQKLLPSIYSEVKAQSLYGTITTTAVKDQKDGDDFTYGYTPAADTSIGDFCLKHKDGYYVTGSVDKDGKITVGDTSTSKPAGNTNCPA